MELSIFSIFSIWNIFEPQILQENFGVLSPNRSC